MTLKVVPERAGLAAAHTRDVHYGYDLLGRQIYARFDSAAGEGITNSFDALGRLTSSTSSMGGVARTFDSQYDAAGNRIVLSSPSNYYASFAYDALGRMIAYKEGATTVVGFNYDDLGRRSGLAFAAGGTSTASYGYDPIGRLSSLTRGLAGSAADDVRTFAYNPSSQIVSQTRTNDAYASDTAVNVNRPYSSNGLNQYLTAGPAGFTYDANGNLISDGSTSFVYDVENRLVSASGAKNATLAYDPLGRLWQTSGAAGITRFVYDGNRLVEEYDGAGYRPRVYVHGPGSDEPIVWYELAGGPVHRFYHSDHQGSIVALADDYGNSLGINAYDAWGIPNAGNVGRFGYTGQTWMPELGLWYYKARFYSPTLGRFLQTDPIGYGGGMNLYHYVGSDPVNSVDPSGLETIVVTGDRCRVVSCGSIMALWDSAAAAFAFVENEKGEGGEKRKPEPRGCSASGAGARARANAAASRLGPVAFDSKSEMALLTQYFRGDTTPYRLNAAEMAQARAYVTTYARAVLGPPTSRSDGLIDRPVWFGMFASEAPLLDGLLGSATGVFSAGGDLVGIRDTFNFDFKDRGGYPFGWAAGIGVALIRADAASCAGNVSIPVSGGTP